MSWSPNDLVSDADLLAYERDVLTQFNADDWRSRRQKAIEDWLFPLLEGQGFDPLRFRTRHTPPYAVATTSSVTTDKADAAKTEDGLNLASILAAGSDVLYLGFDQPFRGLSLRMHAGANTASSLLSVAVWADTWEAVEIEDGTRVGAISLARGGAVTWQLPEGIVRRTVNSIGPAYWARLSMSATPTGCVVGPITVIRRSRLCAAVTFRTLALIFREAPISQDGPWEQKAAWYEAEAERAWLRVMGQIGGEFDSNDDDAIDAAEEGQTAEQVNGGGWRWERA